MNQKDQFGDLESYYSNFYEKMPCSKSIFINSIHNKLSISSKILKSKCHNSASENLDEIILEVGIGHGDHVRFEKAERYVGIDISLNNLLKLKNFNHEKDTRMKVELINGDGLNLPLKSNHFSSIVMTCVAHHVDDVEKLFNELLRVVKKDKKSKIRIMVPTDPGLLFRFIREFTQIPAAKKLGFEGYRLYIARDHKNHFTSIREIAKYVFRNANLNIEYFPFRIPLHDINTHAFFEITFL
jgi:ubiquinone/menaquinone biosynthesis C-methylase UbiE